MELLVDIHTHLKKTESLNQLRFLVGKHSLGIHPWELTDPFNEVLFFEKFIKLKSQFQKNILAIGECGLDRRKEGIANLAIQEMVLVQHMEWAMHVNRPLILHCVRAEADLLKLLKIKKYEGRILLHDFAGNLEAAQAFLKYDCFFSFGKRLFAPKTHAATVMKWLPQNKIFLETDNQTYFSLEDIYQKASLELNINQESSEKLFLANLMSFFSNLDDISPTDIINELSGSTIA